MSRTVHSQKQVQVERLSNHIFEQFLVVGVKNTNNNNNNNTQQTKVEPQVLYQYPTTSITIPDIVNFCFPNGVVTRNLKRSNSMSSLYNLLCQQTDLTHSPNTFIFVLTTENRDILYGICVKKEESVDHLPSFINNDFVDNSIDDNNNNNNSSTTYKVSQRCYCFITRYPFFQFYLDILYTLLDMEHVYQITQPYIQVNNNNLIINKDNNGSSNTLVQLDDSWNETTVLISNENNNNNNNSNNNTPVKGSLTPMKQNSKTITPLKGSQSANALSSYISNSTNSLTNSNTSQHSRHSSTSSLNLSTELENSFTYGYNDNNNNNNNNTKKEFVKGDVVELLKKFREIGIPNPGQPIEFKITNTKSIQFSRSVIDEEDEAYKDWGISLFFNIISKKHLITLINAAIQEKKVVFVSQNLRILSCVVLSLLPLMKPFVYQSVVIPILPTKMLSLLDAPVPFIVGVCQMPDRIPNDVILLNIDDGVLYCQQHIPDLPKFKYLDEFPTIYNELKKTWLKEQRPYLPTSKQLRLSKKLALLFVKSLTSVFDNFREHCITDMSQRNTPITIFIKESFLESVIPEEVPWYTVMVETQIFFHYVDSRLRKMDRKPI